MIEPEEPELILKAVEALELAYPEATECLIGEAGLDATMFVHVSGLSLPRTSGNDAKVLRFRSFV